MLTTPVPTVLIERHVLSTPHAARICKKGHIINIDNNTSYPTTTTSPLDVRLVSVSDRPTDLMVVSFECTK